MSIKMSKRGQERYEKIMEVALESFLNNGYENTSLSDIIEKSGGSLASVYKFFNNKEGLFTAIVERSLDNFCAEIEEKINLKISHKIEDFLTKFANIFFDIICDRKTTLITRIMLIEGYKNNASLGNMFLEQVINRVNQILVDFMEREEIKSQLDESIDPKTAASLFCGLVRNPYHYHAILLNSDIVLSEQEREDHIKTCVKIFLKGITK
ncbi:TetR/AcrR family transcriptional regulator [Campylobacter sp. RM16190]|uniref:TetR/AcrR family transcriptional regulator n=1 Tax=Campylobacter sp. RM16190 TaxID=1705727 RepID=UPI001475E5F1|nr:TetR/AcrR family transcriptional regulator [Campylobacter sp. RM16190]